MRALLKLLVALIVVTAGCLDSGTTQDDGTEGPEAPDASYSPGNATSPVSITAFNVTNDRGNATFYEDDRLRVEVTVAHDGSTNATTQHYLTLRAGGEVILVRSITLQPGQSASAERTLVPDRSGEYPVSATIAGERAEADLHLEKRPRAGEWVGDENVTFRVNDHVATAERVVVNITTRNTMANDTLARTAVSLLCRTPDGAIDETEARFLERPGPGNTAHQNVSFGACEGDAEPHGIRLEHRFKDWNPHHNVVLFRSG